LRRDLGKDSRIVVDAALDWREWTDQENNRSEAVTLSARQLLFERAHLSESCGDNGVDEHSSPADAESAAATAGAGSADADDLPF
jgi:single-stranded DNA-binding protein